MTMADVVEIDAATNTVIERDFTEAELAQRVIDAEEAAALAEVAAEEAAAKVALRESALAKLTALGLTEAEAAEIAGV
jgi:hypothetical protein